MHPTLGGTDLPIAALPVKLAFTTGQKAKPVLLVLLARRDRQGRRAHRVLPDRLEQQPEPVKTRCGSCVPTARLQRAEASVTRTRF